MSPDPQDKATGDSVPNDPNSKTRIAGQLREEAGCCPDHILLFSQSEDLPNHICTEKVPCRPKMEQC